MVRAWFVWKNPFFDNTDDFIEEDIVLIYKLFIRQKVYFIKIKPDNNCQNAFSCKQKVLQKNFLTKESF